MEWITIDTIATSESYIHTPTVTGTLFRFNHQSTSLRTQELKVIVRQAFNDDDNNLNLFDYRLINPSAGKSILLFNKPKELISRRLAIKRVDKFLNEPWTIEIQTLVNNEVIDMPSYPSLPIFSGITSNVASNTVSVSIASITLSAANTNKIGTTITNNAKSAKLYVSVGISASLTVYDKVLAMGEVYESPFNWSGDIFGIWDKADTSATGNAKVKDFS